MVLAVGPGAAARHPLLGGGGPGNVRLFAHDYYNRPVQLGRARHTHPYELQFGEATSYDHTSRILRGEPLYQPLDRAPFTVALYTPLYYWLAAGLRVLFGPGFPPGRTLTFLAGLAAASLLGYIAASQARNRWAGGLRRAFLPLARSAVGLPPADLFFPDDIARTLWSNVFADLDAAYPSLPLYKEDVLGLALSLGAVATIIGGTSRMRLLLGGLLAALAILTKQTFVAASLAGVVWI
jgi:hypothetical protein